MSSQSVRMALGLFAVSLVASGGYYAWVLDEQRVAFGRAGRDFDRLTEQAVQRIGELRQMQQAYVAAGQGAALWMRRADEVLTAVRSDVARLKDLSSDPASISSLGAASQVVDNFAQSDRRVREYARNGQLLMASDIIFTDGAEMIAGAAGHIAAARDAEEAVRDEQEAGLRRRQLGILAAMGGATLFAFVGLRAGARRPAAVAVPSAQRSKPDEPPEHLDNRPAEDSRGEGTANGMKEAVPSPEALKDLAALCGALARVQEPADLISSLERAASLLHASGIVVWLADPSGQELRPALAHGYAPQTLARIPSVARDDRSATAAAFREVAMKIVAGRHGAHGALALPILAGSHCVGVLAAEMREGGEAMEFRQALASIIAAQLSSLAVTPAQEERSQVQWSSGA